MIKQKSFVVKYRINFDLSGKKEFCLSTFDDVFKMMTQSN